MSDAVRGLLVATWVAGVVALLAAGAVQYFFYRRLKSAHPSACRALGLVRPVRYLRYLDAIGPFIWRGRYRPLDDSVLATLGSVLKVLTAIAILGMLSAGVLAWTRPTT